MVELSITTGILMLIHLKVLFMSTPFGTPSKMESKHIFTKQNRDEERKIYQKSEYFFLLQNFLDLYSFLFFA